MVHPLPLFRPKVSNLNEISPDFVNRLGGGGAGSQRLL